MKALEQSAVLLAEARTRAGLSQRELAARAGTAQSVVARVEAGHVSPSLDTLSRLLAATGFALEPALVPAPERDPVIEAYKRDIDRSLLRENLERAPDERVAAVTALARLADEAHRAGRALRAASRGKR